MQGIDVTIYAVIGVVHGKYKVHTLQNWQLTVDQVKEHTYSYLLSHDECRNDYYYIGYKVYCQRSHDIVNRYMYVVSVSNIKRQNTSNHAATVYTLCD